MDIFEEDNENNICTDIWKTINIYKKSPKGLKQTVTKQILTKINKIEYNCMCNMLNRFNNCDLPEEICFAFLYKCKTVCNFCQIKYKNKLEMQYIKKLNSHNYLKIFDYQSINKNTKVLNILINSNNLSLEQIYKILLTNNDVLCEEKTVERIIDAFIESSYDTTKIYYDILLLMLKNEQYLKNFSQLFSKLIINLTKNSKIKIFDLDNVGLFTNNDVVLNYAIKQCSKKQLEAIVDKCSAISISHTNFYDIYHKFDNEFMKKIISKMTNIFSYISYCSSKMNKYKVDVIVESTNIIKSLNLLNDESTYDLLCQPSEIFINYIGEVGYDANGLTKDFFTACSMEFKSLLEECDGYLTIPTTLDLNDMELKFISLMIARSIFVENISPEMKLHPILSYLMVTGGYSINFNHFYNFISHFDIEFINNTFKLLNMSSDTYLTFIDMQGNDKIKNLTREQYIIKQITKKYVHPKLIDFVNGFRVFFKSLYFVDFVNLVIFHKFICGTESYEIHENTPHSLQNNLKITGLVSKQHLLFEKVFIEILSELNSTSIVKLKLFFKYWFATSSIISFSDRTPIIDIQLCSYYTERTKYHCFYSATCFDTLKITIAHKEFLNENTLKSFIKLSIDASLENQNIWESAGVHMQLA